ncbi:hypothetical protein QZH41_016770, partial [Actinostola sp. cb2023]
YSALLRLPDTLSKEQKLQKVEEIVDILDLGKCLNTCIGSPMSRGLSGGEKKRANIGCELITNPSILFLDEPTSGLDSSNALNLIKTLKKFAACEKKTIVMSIHQPSSQIFHLFDKLLLLCNGKIAFYGKSSRALDFFSSIGLICERHFNPADYILEKVTAGKDIEDFIVESWSSSATRHKELKSTKTNDNATTNSDKDKSTNSMNNSNTSLRPSSPISSKTCSDDENDKVLSHENLSFEGLSDNESEPADSVYYSVTPGTARPESRNSNDIEKGPEINSSHTSPSPSCLDVASVSELPMISFKKGADYSYLDIHDDDDDDHDYTDVNTEWVTSFWTQFSVMTERTFKQSKPDIIEIKPCTGSWMLVYKHQDFQTSGTRAMHCEIIMKGKIFFILTYWNFNPMFSALLSFPAERTVINKERAAGYYRLSAYYFGKLVSELPLVVLQPVAFICITYWMSGLNASAAFLQFTFTVLVTCLAAQSVGLFISATVMNFRQCITIASVFGLGCMLLGGFYQQHIPPWLSWFEYVSYLKYTYDALMIVEFSTSKPFRIK